MGEALIAGPSSLAGRVGWGALVGTKEVMAGSNWT